MPNILEQAPTMLEITGLGGIMPMGDQREFKVPDIIEFCISDNYLNHQQLYPRQATFLKTVFLQDELYTQYDYDVLGEWVDGFRFPEYIPDELTPTVHYEGDWGINPDIFDRIEYLKTNGHRWFSVVNAVQGRRSGKGLIGAFCGAYVLWNYICTGNPQDHYGLDLDKRMAGQVYAGKKAQARDNQWRDIVNVIMGAPTFSRFVNQSLGESLTILAASDHDRIAKRPMDSTMDQATFEIVPKEAIPMAARGAATFMDFYDEMAHMVATGVSRSAEEVWNAAEPALGQFKQDSFIYCGSSPATMIGKFYDLVRESLEIDSVTHMAMNPTILTLQLASWDIYQDWGRTVDGDMLLAPARSRTYARDLDGRDCKTIIPVTYFKPLTSAVMEYDARLRRIERTNPESFRVEYRAKWATAQDSYFQPEHIDRAFAPWHGLVLEQLDIGNPGVFDYYAHGDPGKTSSNFGFAIAHIVADPDGSPIPHVVFDRVHAWTPGDFPTIDSQGERRFEMDYETIGTDIKRWGEGFLFTDLSFDQWNSINFVQTLGRYMRTISYKPTMVWERSATAPLNWATAETMKMALNLNRVHMPYYELAELELKFLRKLPGDKVDHPAAGTVTTKDVYDAISIVVYKLIGKDIAGAYGEQFAALNVAMAMPGLQQVSSGVADVRGTSRPVGNPAVQEMFNQQRNPRSNRPVPGQSPDSRRRR